MKMKERHNRIKALIPDWTVENEFFDLRLCPDYETIQLMKPMIEGSCCDNPECQSVVIVYAGSSKRKGDLVWDNENWY